MQVMEIGWINEMQRFRLLLREPLAGRVHLWTVLKVKRRIDRRALRQCVRLVVIVKRELVYS